jgi:hypothetical protein
MRVNAIVVVDTLMVAWFRDCRLLSPVAEVVVENLTAGQLPPSSKSSRVAEIWEFALSISHQPQVRSMWRGLRN